MMKKAAINICEHMLPFLLLYVEVLALIGKAWGLKNWNMATWADSSDDPEPINSAEPLFINRSSLSSLIEGGLPLTACCSMRFPMAVANQGAADPSQDPLQPPLLASRSITTLESWHFPVGQVQSMTKGTAPYVINKLQDPTNLLKRIKVYYIYNFFFILRNLCNFGSKRIWCSRVAQSFSSN